MSATVTAPTPANPPAGTGFFSSISDTFKVIEAGAASVYHRILATGTTIHDWEASNPAIAGLVQEGLTYATGVLTRFGVPVGMIELVGEDIVAALKGLAAGDATVPSVPIAATTTTTVTSATPVAQIVTVAGDVAAVLIPGAAPLVAATEGIIAAIEGGAAEPPTPTP